MQRQTEQAIIILADDPANRVERGGQNTAAFDNPNIPGVPLDEKQTPVGREGKGDRPV